MIEQGTQGHASLLPFQVLRECDTIGDCDVLALSTPPPRSRRRHPHAALLERAQNLLVCHFLQRVPQRQVPSLFTSIYKTLRFSQVFIEHFAVHKYL